MSIQDNISAIRSKLPQGIALVAVSKNHTVEAIERAYSAGVKTFGESRVQELVAKYDALPKDICWHMIGHLQTNKVKFIAPFIGVVESVDSERLLGVINSEAGKCSRVIDVLLEVHIAVEETKSGWSVTELDSFLEGGTWREMKGIRFRGVMGIATKTDVERAVKEEFMALRKYFDQLQSKYFDDNFDTVSLGMSGDWQLAVECGSTSVRIGSAIFGDRNYLEVDNIISINN